MLFLKRAWKRWIAFAHWLGGIQSRIFFTVIYCIFFPPMAIVFKLVADPLQIKKPPTGFTATDWYSDHSVDSARKQS